jgi:hypothetical protein
MIVDTLLKKQKALDLSKKIHIALQNSKEFISSE